MNKNRRRKVGRRVFSVLVAAVVFVTTYALVIPVITASASAYCGLEEHTHSNACYDYVLTCDLAEGEDGHQHDDSCYEEILTCSLEEHTHSLACYSDPEADVELTEDWEATLPTERSGFYAEELAATAKSQLNYEESERNYEVAADGVGLRGYTRYGDWNGEPYANWSMDFVAFCLYYAGIDLKQMPVNTESVDKWIEDLTKAGLVKDAGQDFAFGDLVFFKSEEKNGEDVPHMGIVVKIKAKDIIVIEGDRDDAVVKSTYAKDSDQIVAVAALPDQEADVAEAVGAAAATDAVVVDEAAGAADDAVTDAEDAVEADADDADTSDATEAADLNQITYEGDGFTVIASFGDDTGFSEDTALSVEEIRADGTKKDKTDYDAYCEQTRAALYEEESSLVSARFFDISFEENGEKIEPTGDVSISITYKKDDGETSNSGDKVCAVHLPDDADAEVINADVATPESTTEETVTFTADSFSVYGVVYTVDFSYEVEGKTLEFSLAGGNFISLATLVEELGITKTPEAFVAEVENVEFSDSNLVWVGKAENETTVGDLKDENNLEPEYSADLTDEQIAEINDQTVAAGDWALISLQPFTSEESLTVTMRNGEQIEIRVTDAHEIPDSSANTIDVNKSYLICYEVNGQYYLLKNDGSVDSSHRPNDNDFEGLNSTYCWTFNYVFEEKHLEETLTYVYYLIRPIDNKSKTIALNAEGQDLVQRSNNNVAVVPAEGGGFHLIGYNEVKLNFADGAFFADQLPAEDDGITVHIYEMDSLPTYDYTARSSDETRGTVTIVGGTEKTDEGGTYFEAASNSDKMNAGNITATPVEHYNRELPWYHNARWENKWIFDHWEQDGIPLDRDQYPATINAETLPIPFNGSKLIAYFKQNPNYVVPDSEKEPTTFDDMSNWLNELTTKHVPLDEGATEKTAEVYDYENRIYRVDITSKANFKTFKGDVDMAFCMDVSNSMYFPSKLVQSSTIYQQNPLPIYQINNSGGNYNNKTWLDRNRGWNNPYYLIADQNNTATVFKIYYQEGNWKAQDASREIESDKSFVIGESFHTNWCNDDRYPFTADDNNNSEYMIYDAGDNGRNRFYYLNQSFSGATQDLTDIKNILAVAGDESPDIRIAYNTFNINLGSQRQDFQEVHPITGIDLSNSHGGGTRPDQAFIDAQSFHWQGDERYIILITDGAPQGKREGESDNDFDRISNYVKQQAQTLKDNAGVKFITIGLSMDKVPHGKKLLYDLADTDKDGNPMFYMAESASDLPNILRQVTKTIMDDAIVYADVTDSVGEAFYPVDKTTGLPLNANEMIDIEGRKTTDISQAAGIVQPDGKTIKWLNQAIDPTNGWHGTVYVKAKEDLIGGNAVKTNSEADIKATKYKMGDTEYLFDQSLIRDKLKSLEIDFETPRVNVNELSFPNATTEWTVYLGTEVDPKEQLRLMYENVLVSEVVNTNDSLHYPLVPNSITDDREDEATGTVKTFALAPVILDIIESDSTLSGKYLTQQRTLNWDAFLTDILTEDGVTVPYHPYGIEGEDSTIVIKLTKEIADGEETDLINHSPHDTTVVNGTDEEGNSVPVEKYILTVQYNPDYDHVLPPGQGGNPDNNIPYYTGTFGTMYQGHAAGRETSTNTHIINVFAKKLQLMKVDQEQATITTSNATFELYRKATNTDTKSVNNPRPGLIGDYVLVEEFSTDSEGIAIIQNPLLLLDDNEPYYLVETKAPDGYNLLTDVLQVKIETRWINKTTDETSDQRPTLSEMADWQQQARVIVTGNGVVTPSGQEEVPYDSINDVSTASYTYKIINNAGYALPSTGGSGTIKLYLLGALIVVVAGAGMVAMKRRRRARGGDLLR